MSEDCLYLNVFAPARPSVSPLPVFVWIHGGGLFMGDSDGYDPRLLVNDGNVVFVSLNYRLNVFGFFSQSSINHEGHAAGNYGIMDQQFALEWVKRNISRFGGDPSRVTIAGESAGGFSVWAHLVSPKSAGLFHRAIVESGSPVPVSPTPSLETRENMGSELATLVGCAGGEAACLRAVSTKDLLKANEMPPGGWGSGRFHTGLIADGQTLPGSIDKLFLAGKFSRVPVMNGTNFDEYTWFQAMKELKTGERITPSAYLANLTAVFGDIFAQRVLARYPAARYADPSAALAAVMGDATFICGGNRRLNRILQRYDPRVYMYEFDVPDTPSPWRRVSFPYLSAHTLEIPYLFPRFSGASGISQDFTPAQSVLSRHMLRYWSNFAWSGTPNDPASGSPAWPPYEQESDTYMSLRTPEPEMQMHFGVKHNCDLWDSLAEQQTASRK